MGLGWHRTETKGWALRKWIKKLVKYSVEFLDYLSKCQLIKE